MINLPSPQTTSPKPDMKMRLKQKTNNMFLKSAVSITLQLKVIKRKSRQYAGQRRTKNKYK